MANLTTAEATVINGMCEGSRRNGIGTSLGATFLAKTSVETTT